MAEDSMSFKGAFEAEKVGERTEGNKTFHIFENKLTKVSTHTATGKLGDMSIRLGRYKLIRFNAPKVFYSINPAGQNHPEPTKTRILINNLQNFCELNLIWVNNIDPY